MPKVRFDFYTVPGDEVLYVKQKDRSKNSLKKLNFNENTERERKNKNRRLVSK